MKIVKLFMKDLQNGDMEAAKDLFHNLFWTKAGRAIVIALLLSIVIYMVESVRFFLHLHIKEALVLLIRKPFSCVIGILICYVADKWIYRKFYH